MSEPTPADIARYGTRQERARLPLARGVLEAVAVDHGVCIRPLAMRRTNLTTGETEIIPAPCGATLAATCPPCAQRARKLRMAQCAAGWHLDDEPLPDPDPPTDEQRELTVLRAELEAARAACEAAADLDQVADLDDGISDVDAALADLGVRGKAAPERRSGTRRARSTRRRQDAPDLPRQPVDRRTLGRTFTAPDGRVWRPSLFLTLTCDSYGRVGSDGTPVHPDSYDYRRAARDAIHFPKLIDRFWQNLRRAVGWDVQYFAALEPQRRLAPHLHAAIRGTIPRTALRQVAAATYHQVWWPACDRPAYPPGRFPVWDEPSGGYVDPDAATVLPTWDEALDAIADDDDPVHVVRFGVQIRADGVTSASNDVGRLVGYLTKYLTKSLDTCHAIDTAAQRTHIDRLAVALRFEPCAPSCANWLLYAVQPRGARAGLIPGCCKGKAHRRETLGFGGRRVLASRRWSGKTLADHRADRRTWVRDQLAATDSGTGTGPTDPRAFVSQLLRPGDPGVPRREHLLMRAVADRVRWSADLTAARIAAGAPPPDQPAAA